MLYLVRHGLERELAAQSLRLKRYISLFGSPHPISGHDLPVRRPATVSARAVLLPAGCLLHRERVRRCIRRQSLHILLFFYVFHKRTVGGCGRTGRRVFTPSRIQYLVGELRRLVFCSPLSSRGPWLGRLWVSSVPVLRSVSVVPVSFYLFLSVLQQVYFVPTACQREGRD